MSKPKIAVMIALGLIGTAGLMYLAGVFESPWFASLKGLDDRGNY